MADETTDVVLDENIIEVDEIIEAVDPDNAIQDADGRIIQYTNDAGKTVKLKGSVNPFEEKKEDKLEGKTKPSAKPAADPNEEEEEIENIPGGDINEGQDPEEDEVEYANDAEYILRKSGYTKDEIDLGGDIGKVKIADLTDVQQRLVMRQEFDATVSEYQELIEELESKTKEATFDNPQHQQFFDYLKEGGDIKKLAKEILSRDPAAQAKMLSDEDIIKMGIKKEYSEFTDEEVEAEFKDMTDAQVARRAKALRSKMEKSQPDFADMTAAEKQTRQISLDAELATFKSETDNIRKAAKGLKEIGGYKLEDAHRNFLLNKVIPSQMEDDSEFIQGLQDPSTLLKLQFYATYGDKLSEYHYARGQAAAAQGKRSGIDESELSDEPVRVFKGNSSKAKAAKKSIDDFPSFGEWVNAEDSF